MDSRLIWRTLGCTALVLLGASLAGCAALDLLGGHLPGEEEEPEPLVDPRPYPGSRRLVAERPAAVRDAAPLASGAPAPIVAAPAASRTPVKPETQAPARASLSDEQAKANSQAAPSPAAQPGPAAPAANNAAASAAAKSPAAASTNAQSNADSLPRSTSADSVNPAQAAGTSTTSHDPKTAGESDKKEATPEERLAEILRQRDKLIAALEEELKLHSGQQDVDGQMQRRQQQLRLLYLLAERSDDAVAEIESLPEAEQEAFKQLMFGLSTWLSPEEDRRPTLRNARVLRSLKDAAGQLSAAAKLDVRNLRFCESVEGFGWYKEFPVAQFRAKQQVILYAEVENFATEKKGTDTYETELAVSYQLFDASGTLVDERELPTDKEVCRNQRRDYFLAYRIYLPEGVAAGRYRLDLTVEDLKAKAHYQGRKLGDGTIEFSIR